MNYGEWKYGVQYPLQTLSFILVRHYVNQNFFKSDNVFHNYLKIIHKKKNSSRKVNYIIS